MISLNFDLSWHGSKQGKKQPKLEIDPMLPDAMEVLEHRRLYASLPPSAESPRVWFPNGCLLEPKYIRMGLRDYGAAPSAINRSFRLLKKWERQWFKEAELREDAGAFARLAAIMDSNHDNHDHQAASDLPRSWVAEFLYRPLFFAGVGLSDQEIGFWWLIVQRYRNLSRVKVKSDKMRIRVLVHRELARKEKRLDFWSAQPFGIEPIFCDDWGQGYEELRAAAQASCSEL